MTLAVEVWSLNHWAAREGPTWGYFGDHNKPGYRVLKAGGTCAQKGIHVHYGPSYGVMLCG